MAQLSEWAALLEKMRRNKMMSPMARGARGSYGSRTFKGRNSMAGLMKERKAISPIMNAMMGAK